MEDSATPVLGRKVIALMEGGYEYEAVGQLNYRPARRMTRRRMFYLMLITLVTVAGVFILLRGNKNSQYTDREKVIRQMREKARKAMHPTQIEKDEFPPAHAPEMAAEPLTPQKQTMGSKIDRRFNGATFIPTTEWQKIPQDAILPGGCDVKVDFSTGERMARLHNGEAISHENVPAIVEELPELHQPEKKTIVEERLDDILSDDMKVRMQALSYFDVEAHTSQVGESICRARNYSNLLTLLESRDSALRRQAGTILAGAVHNNGGAIKAALEKQTVTRLTARLSLETDATTQRMIIASISYMTQPINGNDVGGLHVLEQFNNGQGYTALTRLLKTAHSSDSSLTMRIITLLCEFGRLEHNHSPDYPSQALQLLNSTLANMRFALDEATLDSIRIICEIEEKSINNMYPNIRKFCKKQKFE